MRYLFFLLAALTGYSATVEINLRDFAGASLNSQVTITNTSNPVFGGSNVYTLPVQKYQPRNGQVTATLHAGGYKALIGPYSITFNVPDSTNSYTLSQLATNASTISTISGAWYLASNPSNYVTASITNGLARTYTNAPAITNAGSFVVDGNIAILNGSATTLLSSSGDVAWSGTATGDGSGITNIGTNSMSAAAYAAFIGGGSGDISSASSNNMVANLSSGSVFVGIFTTNNAGFVPAVSGDGIRWDVAQGGSMTWSNGWNVANNSIARISANNYLMATFWGTNVSASATEDSFALWTSTNLLKWNFVGLHAPAVAGLTQLWAPELFNDSGTIYCYFSGSTNNAASLGIYVVRALDSTWTNWTAPTLITNIGTNTIDAFVVKDSGTNYLFFKNETTKYIDLAASTSPTNGFSIIKSNDWAGWGGEAEAPTVSRRPDGRWVALFDRYNDNTYLNYSISTNLLTNWTTRAQIVAPEQTLRHGTFTLIPFSEAAPAVLDAQSGTNTAFEQGVITARSGWNGAGQMRVIDSGGTQAGYAIYSSASANPWLINGTAGVLTFWGPSGGVMAYNNSTRTLTITSNLTVLGSVTAGSGLGGGSFTGITNHQNAETSFHVVNTNTSSGAYAMFAVQNALGTTDKGLIGLSGTGFPLAANAYNRDSFWVLSDAGVANGMNIGATATGSAMKLYAGANDDTTGLCVIITNKGGIVQSNWVVNGTNSALVFSGNGSRLTNLNGTVTLTGTGSNTFTNGVITLNTNDFGAGSSGGVIRYSLPLQHQNTTSSINGQLFGSPGLYLYAAFGGFVFNTDAPLGYKTNIVNVHYLTTNSVAHSWYIYANKYWTNGAWMAGATVGPSTGAGAVAMNTNYVVVSFTNTFTSNTNIYHAGNIQNATCSTTDRVIILNAESVWYP